MYAIYSVQGVFLYKKNRKEELFMKIKFRPSVLLGAALSILLLFTVCPNVAGGGGGGTDVPVPKVKVTLKKTVGGNVKVEPALSDDGMVSQYTNLTLIRLSRLRGTSLQSGNLMTERKPLTRSSTRTG